MNSRFLSISCIREAEDSLAVPRSLAECGPAPWPGPPPVPFERAERIGLQNRSLLAIALPFPLQNRFNFVQTFPRLISPFFRKQQVFEVLPDLAVFAEVDQNGLGNSFLIIQVLHAFHTIASS